MDFFDSLSETTQLILALVIIAVLFFLVLANNKRNKDKQYGRKKRNFRENYYNRKNQE